ncbi:MAG TPA: MMPL family transporter, partial [Candidatus Saccharimonadales bacterium]|nr:MMPL family transporter [Candidatus Saccharimonadales bacterium]
MKPEKSLLVNWSLFVYKHAWPILILGLLYVIAAGIFGLGVFNRLETNGQDFQDPSAGSTKVLNIGQSNFANSGGQIIILFSSPGASIVSPKVTPMIISDLTTISKIPHVQQVTSYFSTKNGQFVSTDQQYMYASVSIDRDFQNETYTAIESFAANQLGPVQVRLGGSVAANLQVNDQVKKDLKKAETLSFPILATLLLLFFGTLVAALTPLALGGLSIFAALFIMRLLSEITPISSYAINIVTLLGLGLAIDYSLFMVARFREELAKHGDVEVAVAITVNRSGRTIIFSGVTVAISLLSLLVFPQSLLRSLGLGGATVVLSTVLLTLTLLPAALRIIGYRINKLPVLRRRIAQPTTETSGFWYRFSQFVMRNAAVVFILVSLLLLAIASNFRFVTFSSPGLNDAPEVLASRQVNDILTNNFHANT